jgi:hypothetical protein
MRLPTTFALLLLAGCDQSPPFDQLPLRDALRADPDVIASLPETSRIQLGARFEGARENDVTIDRFATSNASTPATLVVVLDGVRLRRQGESLIVGLLSDGAAWAIKDCAGPSQAAPLPPFEGAAAAATATMERRALEGEAGAAVRALLAASGAHHLHRVVGWPVGAVAIDDTIYVNASWLVSLAPVNEESIDGGAVDGSASHGGFVASAPFHPALGSTWQSPQGTSPPSATRTSVVRGVLASGNRSDAGVPVQPPGSDPPSPTVSDTADACSQCAAGCDTSGSDSCDSSDDSSDACDTSADASDGSSTDSCDSTSDDSSASCASAGDGTDAASCQVAHSRGHTSSGTRIWLMAPLAFLLLKRRP